jgi:hypothetical protein
MAFKIMLSTMSLFFASTSFAAGGFECIHNGKDANDWVTGFALNFSGVTTRGMGSPIVSAQGELSAEVGDDGYVKNYQVPFNKDNVSQYWSDGSEFKLLIYDEKWVYDDKLGEELLQWVMVTIETKANESYEYVGTMAVQGANWSYESLPVSCSVEL